MILPVTASAGRNISSFVVDSVRVSKSASGICSDIFRFSAEVIFVSPVSDYPGSPDLSPGLLPIEYRHRKARIPEHGHK